MKNRLLQAMKSLPMLAEDKEKFVNEITKNSSSGIKECYYKMIDGEALVDVIESHIPTCMVINSVIIDGYLIKHAYKRLSSTYDHINLMETINNGVAFSTLYQSCNALDIVNHDGSYKIVHLSEGDIEEKSLNLYIQMLISDLGRYPTEEELIMIKSALEPLHAQFRKGIISITKEEFDSLITNK